MAKLTYSHEIETVNNKTGEILSTERSKTIQLPQEPPFVKLYLDDIVKLNDLPKGCSGVLYELIKGLSYEGTIVVNAAVKRSIAKRLSIKEQTISNAITSFIKKDIMRREDTGIYMLNPTLFAKGSWQDVRKLHNKYIELSISYKNGKRVFKTTLKDEGDSGLQIDIEDDF